MDHPGGPNILRLEFSARGRLAHLLDQSRAIRANRHESNGICHQGSDGRDRVARTPGVLGTSTIVDFGYDHAVMLLVPSAPQPPCRRNRQCSLPRAEVLVCREICFRARTQISLTLPIKSMPPEVNGSDQRVVYCRRMSLPRRAPREWKFNLRPQKECRSCIIRRSFAVMHERISFRASHIEFPLTRCPPAGRDIRAAINNSLV